MGFSGQIRSDTQPELREPSNLTTDQSNESPGSTPESNRSKIADPLPWIMMVLALSLDQLTKWVVVENLAVGESWPAMGLFRFTHTWNTGTAFSLFQGAGDILTWVSFGAVGVLTWIYRSIDDPPRVLRIAFGLQFGGAIGNIADRIRLGHVIDFIDVGWWPVFNIADSSIVIGIGLMIFYFWFLDESSKSDDPIDEVTTETAGPTVASTSLDSPE